MFPLRIAAGAFLVAGLIASPAAAVTALEGKMHLRATSNVGHSPALATDTAISNDSWSNAPHTLSTTARATAVLDQDNTVVTRATERATWNGANSGDIHVEDFGWDFDVANGDINQIDALLQHLGNPSEADWTYTFRADQDGVFNLDFNISAVGNHSVFGLGEWRFVMLGDGLKDVQLSETFQGTSGHASGSASQQLRAGATYTVALFNNTGLGSFTPDHSSATLTADFHWDIRSAVPEPATWALMITGFGLAGAALRRRNGTAATA